MLQEYKWDNDEIKEKKNTVKQMTTKTCMLSP